MRTLVLNTAEDTHALGWRLGQAAAPGTFVALVGDLGAGKTALVRGLARGLGVSGRVQSPTFVLVQVHEGGRLPLWHADWYRLGSEEELEHLALDELDEGVVAVEWADRFPGALPPDRLEIRLADEPGGGRRAEIEATGSAHVPLEVACG